MVVPANCAYGSEKVECKYQHVNRGLYRIHILYIILPHVSYLL